MTYASPADVAAEMGRSADSLTPAEEIQYQAWLGRVEATIKTRIPDLDARVASGALDEATVISVEAAAVARKALNPEGLRQVTKSIDDGSVTKVRDTELSSGVLFITDDEWLLLLPRRPRGAFSVTPQYVNRPHYVNPARHW